MRNFSMVFVLASLATTTAQAQFSGYAAGAAADRSKELKLREACFKQTTNEDLRRIACFDLQRFYEDQRREADRQALNEINTKLDDLRRCLADPKMLGNCPP